MPWAQRDGGRRPHPPDDLARAQVDAEPGSALYRRWCNDRDRGRVETAQSRTEGKRYQADDLDHPLFDARCLRPAPQFALTSQLHSGFDPGDQHGRGRGAHA